MKNNFSTKPELLAPAGSFDCLKAAVQNGADAVYVGLKTGSARMGAENFSLAELQEAVAYAHLRGVKVYLALNTLIFDNEFQQTYALAQEAEKTGIDAIIVQDLGLACKILANKENFRCEIHASTQMSIYNKAGASVLKKMGFDRCITARELSLKEIKDICFDAELDIEVFCHGALCMSLSGQCLMSSFIGGRSGNRGTCAQPCRKKYSLSSSKISTPAAYRLSPADFASLSQIKELITTGVKSLKIEGRLKSPEYVAAVTRSYKEAIDSLFEGKPFDSSQHMKDMQVLFGRGSFTTGYLNGKLPFKDITFRSAGRVGLPIGKIHSAPTLLPTPKKLPKNLMRFSIDATVEKSARLQCGDGITVYSFDNDEQKIICGGTVNSVEEISNNKIKITIVGNVYKNSINKPPYVLTVTDDARLRAAIDNHIKSENKRMPVFMRFKGVAGDFPELELFDSNGNTCLIKGPQTVQTAQKVPTAIAEIQKQLSKLGDTPFFASEIIINTDNNVFIPVSVLNMMRRNGANELIKKITGNQNAIPNAKNAALPQLYTSKNTKGGISLFFYKAKSFLSYEDKFLPDILKPYKDEDITFYIPLLDFAQCLDKIRKIKNNKNRIVLYFPFISLGKAIESTVNSIQYIYDNGLDVFVDGFMCQNIGDFDLLKDKNKPVYCDYSFNITNIHSFNVLSAIGVSRATISVEALNFDFKESFAQTFSNAEVVIGGPIVLMRSRHCYIDEGECNSKAAKCSKADYSLKDELGCDFPILPQKEDCCSILLSHKPVEFSLEQIKKIRSENPNVTLRVNIL